MAQKVSKGLYSAAGKVGSTSRTAGSFQKSAGVQAAKSYGSRALNMMGDYPRRTMGGAAAGLGAMGAYGGARRRGSQNYPMY